MLPKNVSKSLADSDQNIAKIETHINIQKSKVDADIDALLQDITNLLNNTKASLHGKLDTFLEMYR